MIKNNSEVVEEKLKFDGEEDQNFGRETSHPSPFNQQSTLIEHPVRLHTLWSGAPMYSWSMDVDGDVGIIEMENGCAWQRWLW